MALTIHSKYDKMIVKQKYNICIDNISVLEGSKSLSLVAAFLLSLRRFLSSSRKEERKRHRLRLVVIALVR